jgi:hypothetical protein
MHCMMQSAATLCGGGRVVPRGNVRLSRAADCSLVAQLPRLGLVLAKQSPWGRRSATVVSNAASDTQDVS